MRETSNDPMSVLIKNASLEDAPDADEAPQDDSSDDDGDGIGTKAVEGASSIGSGIKSGLKSLGSMLAGPAGAIGALATKATSAIGSALNIGQGASRVVGIALAVTIAGTGAVGAASLFNANDVATLYVGTVDCKEVIDDAQKRYGFGEREIPETVGGLTLNRSGGGFGSPYSVMMGRAGGINANLGTEDRQIAMNAIGYANGMDESMFLRSAGDYPVDSPYGSFAPFYFHDEDGFCKLNDYYILGVAPAAFGRTEDEACQVGDWITFYFEDGQYFDSIIVDTKGDSAGPGYDFLNGTSLDTIVSLPDPQGLGRPNDVCGWGHCNDHQTVELFEFWSSTVYVPGDGVPPGPSDGKHFPKGDPIELIAKSLDEPDGAAVVSFTNHGTAPEVADVATRMGMSGSILGTALETQGAARNKGMQAAANECTRDCGGSDFDNSNAAQAALSLAYSQSKTNGEGYPGTELWLELYPKLIPEDGEVYPRSCDRAVCGPIRWSGTDEDFPNGDTSAQFNYMVTSDRWEQVSAFTGSNIDVLEPGDITITSGQHVAMYVGEELIKEHEFTGDADVGPVEAGSFSVSGSIGDYVLMSQSAPSRAPGVGFDIAGPYAFRCIKPTGSEKYADLGDFATVAGGSGCNGGSKGTSGANKQSAAGTVGDASSFVASCLAEWKSWKAGDTPKEKFWGAYSSSYQPWCSEFVGWNLEHSGLVRGKTMPSDPTSCRSYYDFYTKHPEYGTVHENDGTYTPKEGDLVLCGNLSHTEMVYEMSSDGKSWTGISGGSSVGKTKRSLSSDYVSYFVTIDWDACMAASSSDH